MLIDFPASPLPASIEWQIDQPAQANRAEFTGKRRVTLLTAAPRWYAKVTLPAIVGEDRVLDWRAFVVDCDGIANTFRLIACDRPQISGINVTVDGAGQSGLEVATKGWGAAGTKLKRGQFVTIADQLLMLRKPVVADADGKALLYVKPYIRFATVDAAHVEATEPYALMSMSDPKNGWKSGIGQQNDISFDCEESF